MRSYVSIGFIHGDDRIEQDLKVPLLNGVAYATAMLYSDKEQIVQVLYGGSGENLIYCNGQIVGHTAKENEFVADKYKLSLHLKAGSNRILIKSRQLVNDWKFSFRVDGRIVKSHKQKYYL